jgi:hypothetical protein
MDVTGSLAIVSLAVLALTLEIANAYIFNAVHKGGQTWRSGTAVHYVMHQDRMCTPLAVLMRPYMTLWLSRIMSWGALATEAIARIGQLYGIETDIRGRSPGERREVRQARARPLLDSMRQWLQANLAKLSKKSDTAVAIRYALGRWTALTRYCTRVPWRSTTTRPSVRYAPSLSDGRTISSPGLTRAVSAPLRSTA